MNGRIKKRNEVATSTFGALPMIGKLKIGMKVWNEKAKREIPTSLDYFRATGPYAEKFHEVYTEKPNKVEIVFPSDDVMQVCREEVEGRSEKNGKRYGYSYDGIVYYLWDEHEEDYLPTEDQAAIDAFTAKHAVVWKYTLYLNFVVLKMRGVLGQWQFSTKGDKSSMPQIIKAFDTMREGIGTIVNVPFDLQVEKVTSQKPTVNKRTGNMETRTFPVVKLIPNISPENMDTLRGYLQTNANFKRFGVIMTDERIESLSGGMSALNAAPEYTEEQQTLIKEGDKLASVISSRRWWELKANGFQNCDIAQVVEWLRKNQPTTPENITKSGDEAEGVEDAIDVEQEPPVEHTGTVDVGFYMDMIGRDGDKKQNERADAAKKAGNIAEIQRIYDEVTAQAV